MSTQALFREEALAARSTQWLGTVLFASMPSHRVFALFAAIATALLVALLAIGTYPRTARVGGFLVPEKGIVRVLAPQPGMVTALSVSEGSEVQKGSSLLTLSAEIQSSALGATRSEVTARLVAQRDSLKQQLNAQRKLSEQQQRTLSARVGALGAEEEKLAREIELQRARTRIAKQSTGRQRALRREGVASEVELAEAEASRLAEDAKLLALERDRLIAARDRATLEAELQALPLKSQAELATIERAIAAVAQDLAEAEALREIVVPAPETGVVTAIQIERGGRPDLKTPLMSIVPAGSDLEAHLFCPSRAVGFLKAGQRVLLRYQAYPYQKFGHQEAVVTSISRSAVSPADLPPQLAGLTSLLVGGEREPVYRVTVRLASQTIAAYGESVPLRAGTLLEADIVIERRRLYEWVLEPLYTLRRE